MRNRSAFTAVELMVVMAIIAVLMSLLLPMLRNARRSALQAACMSNLQQQTLAWTDYARDNNDYMFYVPEAMSLTPDTAASLSKLGLFQYCPNVSLWRCPADPSPEDHLRTYSINEYLNGWGNGMFGFYDIQHLLQIKSPCSTFVFIEEMEYAPPGFVIQGINPFVVYDPRQPDVFGDIPATFHNYGQNISFADGHVEYMKFTDPRTGSPLVYGDFLGHFAYEPNNADLKTLERYVGL